MSPISKPRRFGTRYGLIRGLGRFCGRWGCSETPFPGARTRPAQIGYASVCGYLGWTRPNGRVRATSSLRPAAVRRVVCSVIWPPCGGHRGTAPARGDTLAQPVRCGTLEWSPRRPRAALLSGIRSDEASNRSSVAQKDHPGRGTVAPTTQRCPAGSWPVLRRRTVSATSRGPERHPRSGR